MTDRSGDLLRFPLGAGRSESGSVRPPLPRTSKARVDPGRLGRPLDSLPAVGGQTVRRFAALGIVNVGDLLLHVPFRHEPASALVPLSALPLDQEVTIKARVVSTGLRPTRRRGLSVLEALLDDGTARVQAVWYNQPYLRDVFASQPEVLARGVFKRRGVFTSFQVKRHELLGAGDEGVHTMGLVPVYPATGELSVRTIRTTLKKAAPEAVHLVDPLPSEMLARLGFARKAEALLTYHFPGGMREAAASRARLAFEELLLLQLALLGRRTREEAGRCSRPLPGAGRLTEHFLASLPYRPTAAQGRVMAEIDADLAGERPMRRLLQGDVGSGKTMVATYCLLRAVESGGQAALMAPTEVLADQHAARLAAQLGPLGVRVSLLKGSQTATERREVCGAVSGGEPALVVGTHALIQQGVAFADLRVAVVDEQHRFGVGQREALADSASDGSTFPHVLHMTATPIPRTLSLTLYGDLDLSVIDELPPGRRPIKSKVVYVHEMERMWSFLRAELDRGQRAYVVCPLVEESAAAGAAAAVSVHEELSGGELRGYRLRLLHGQLPASEKRQAMADFASGEAQVLVATTVIEVGIDVAEATVMIILGARRFGLSQLHQLRGRVGRGAAESFCFLEAGHGDQESLERLRLFARTSDGFALAEADLQARGEGQIFGDRQSGAGDLRVARVLRDGALLEKARQEALLLLDGSSRGPAAGAGDAPREGVDPRLLLLFEAAEQRFGGRAHLVGRA
jgi:ATP-dependent DNA helicase RecG